MPNCEMEQPTEIGLTEAVEAQQVPNEPLIIGNLEPPKADLIDRIRHRLFSKRILNEMIKSGEEIYVRKRNTGKWYMGRAIRYVAARNAVEVEWNDEEGRCWGKLVQLEEFLRWQCGKVGKRADKSGF